MSVTNWAIIVSGAASVVAGLTTATYFYFFGRKADKVTLKDPNVKISLKLICREKLSSDTFRYKFALPSIEHVLGLPVGKHMYFSARINGELVVRPYTPVSLPNATGFVDFIIKSYRPNGERFPNGGKMSQYLEHLKVGTCMDMRGPTGHIEYINKGHFKIKRDQTLSEYTAKQINLIAGGTGITPMLQIAAHILHVEQNKDICIRLLYANNTENDILARDEIEKLASDFPLQFSFWYTVTQAPEGWRYDEGFVTEKILETRIFPASDHSITLICGPPPMINFACMPNLKKIKLRRK